MSRCGALEVHEFGTFLVPRRSTSSLMARGTHHHKYSVRVKRWTGRMFSRTCDDALIQLSRHVNVTGVASRIREYNACEFDNY